MEITEVPINPAQRSKKKFSSKVRKQADKYLAEKGISIEQLAGEQQQCVLKYIKAKRAMKWMVPAGVIGGLIWVCLSFYALSVISHFTDVFMPDTTVIIQEDGTEQVVELDRELIGGYGRLCAILGGVLVTAFYSGVSAFIGLIGSILNIREIRKVLNAFLPAVTSTTQPDQKTTSDLVT